MTLLGLEPGHEARIAALDVEANEGALLRAMGLHEGSSVRVLRRGGLGGPLQVRVGEAIFAVDRSLARVVRVTTDAP